MEKSTNLTAVLKCTNDLSLQETDIPSPGKGQVQVCMKCVGICGSDVHYWTHGRIGDRFIVRSPLILGHESSGIVSDVGSGVADLKIGDRVAIEPAVPCRECEYCLTGRYNLCHDIRCLATPPYDGSLRQFHVHDAVFCHKLPEDVSLEEGALLEPLSVGVHACRRANLSLGDKVLICGCGPIGLVTLLAAKAAGATYVLMTDVNEVRLKFAKSLGADDIIHVQENTEIKILAEKIRSYFFDTNGPHVTFECSGAESSVQLGCLLTKSGGVLMLIGAGPKEFLCLPIIDALCREVDIRGVFRYANCYPIALSLIASKKINVKPLITHNFKLNETLKAFTTARDQEDGVIKVMIHC